MSELRSQNPRPNPNTVPISQPLADLQILYTVVGQLKQAVDSLSGQRGRSTDRAVTFNDLVDLGLVTMARATAQRPTGLPESITTPVTVAMLPAAGVFGRTAFVSDATATTFGTVVIGGGASRVPVYDDGSDWRIG